LNNVIRLVYLQLYQLEDGKVSTQAELPEVLSEGR